MKPYRLMMLSAALSLAVASPATHADTTAAAWTDPVTGIEFVRIPKGCFRMGRENPVPFPWWAQRTPIPAGALAGRDEMPRHEVCLDEFWMSRHEVGIEAWRKVMGPAPHAGAPGTPVSGVTWQQATDFATVLSRMAGATARFRLPTEAEWEYACRGGTTEEIVANDAELASVAWYGIPGQRVDTPTKVGQRAANPFGLFDMLGNAWEWVQDSYGADSYGRHDLYNPVVNLAGANRVLRGASHRSEPFNVRCGKRAHYPADGALPAFGFRLVRTAP